MERKQPKYHVLPVNDRLAHVELLTCKCKPEVKHESGYDIAVHHSFDGREFWESDNPNIRHTGDGTSELPLIKDQ